MDVSAHLSNDQETTQVIDTLVRSGCQCLYDGKDCYCSRLLCQNNLSNLDDSSTLL